MIRTELAEQLRAIADSWDARVFASEEEIDEAVRHWVPVVREAAAALENDDRAASSDVRDASSAP